MKKKLEAELISIAHRILKLKNRAELDQLQQETLRLYEKISVLKFVEDNFNDVKPTIGYASAEEKLEEIYGIEEKAPVQANEQEAKEEEKKAKVKSEKPKAEDEPQATSHKPQAEEEPKEKESEKSQQPATGTQQPITDNQQPTTDNQEEVAEGGPASEEEKRITEEETDESVEDNQPEEPQANSQQPKEEVQDGHQPSTDNRQPTPSKQKEITFEDYLDYKEPEFIKKADIENPQSINKEFLPKEPEIIQKQEDNAAALSEEPKEETQPTPIRDWRDWEPSTSPYGSRKEEPQASEPQATSQKAQEELSAVSSQPAAATPNPEPTTGNQQPATGNQHLKTINLGLNDRIAFEKNLFGGSGEDLNRVISQLNTLNTFGEAKDFINDLVKPDYNNWKGKEEYEERLMELVEKRFS